MFSFTCSKPGKYFCFSIKDQPWLHVFDIFRFFFQEKQESDWCAYLIANPTSLTSGRWVARFAMVPTHDHFFLLYKVLWHPLSTHVCWAAQLQILLPALWGMCFLTFMFSISHKTGLKYIVFFHPIGFIMTIITLFYCCSICVHYISIPN